MERVTPKNPSVLTVDIAFRISASTTDGDKLHFIKLTVPEGRTEQYLNVIVARDDAIYGEK